MFVDLVGSTALAERPRPRGPAGGDPLLPGRLRRRGRPLRGATSPSIWATACWPTSAGRGRARTRPSGPSGRASPSSRRSPSCGVPGGDPLAARVGIATGLVVVGDLLGEGAAREEAVVGETPNLAARLQQRWPSPAAWSSRMATRRLLGRAVRGRGSRAAAAAGLRGAGAGLAGARRAPGRGPVRGAARGGRPDAAGRPRARARPPARPLGAGHGRRGPGGPARGRARHRQVADRGGAAGAARRRAAPAPPLPVLAAAHRQRAVPGHRRSSSAPPASAATTSRGGRLAKLEALLRRGGRRTAPTLAPLLAALLEIPPDGRYPPLGLTPQQRKAKTLEALARPARGAGAARSRCCWCSRTCTGPTRPRSSCSAHRRRPDRAAAGAGGAHLPAGVRAALDGPRPRHAARAQPAGPPAKRRRWRQRVAGGKALPAEVLEQIVARTDGVPLFVEELTKAVLEAGCSRVRRDVLDDRCRRWRSPRRCTTR